MNKKTRQRLTRFGFTAMPFSDEIRKQYFDRERTAHLRRLKDFLNLRGFAMITGPPGCGKTSLAETLCEDLPGNTHKVAYVPFSTLTDADMLKTVCAELGIGRISGRGRALGQISEHVMEIQPMNPVIIFDELQNVSQITLETIRLMANFNLDGKNYFSIIMIGTEDFARRFKLRANQPLAQRISTFCQTRELDRENTLEYIRHHFKQAGAAQTPVSEQVMNFVYDSTNGNPRMINNIMLAALREAAPLETMEIEIDQVRAAAESLMISRTEG